MEAIKGIRMGQKSLLVEPIANDPNEKTTGGLYLSEAAAERHNERMFTGRVVAKGSDGFEYGKPLTVDCEVGDKIIYGPHVEFRFKGILHHMVFFSGHVATLEE